MKKNNYLYIYLLLLPIIDLISSLTSRLSLSISLGSILKGLFILMGIIYVIFFSGSKYRKITIYYFTFIFIYLLGYFIFKSNLIDKTYFFSEINYLFKFIYFPIATFTFINMYDELKNYKDNINKIMVISLIFYIIIICIPTLLNINFSSYSNIEYAGSVGWFYSANEVSTILLLLYPFIFTLKGNLKKIILFILSLYTISLIGTKVTLFGILIITFLIFISSIFKNKTIKNKMVIMTFIMFIITSIFMANNYASMNLRQSLSNEEDIANLKEELNNYNKKNNITYAKWLKSIQSISSKLLSNRDLYALNTYHVYKDNYESGYLLFGMGFSNTIKINNKYVEKLIEIDILDIFFHLGLLAVVIFIYPFIFIFKRYTKLNYKISLLTLIILLTLGISTCAGHVYLAPAVSIYITIYLIYLSEEIDMFKKEKLKKNKIAILALHLGYGGVENSIITTANMLCEDYDVEIVSMYKNKEIPFKINDKVKVTYLSKTISNKKEVINSLKNFKLLTFFKESFKSIYILTHKYIWLKNYLIYSNAYIIISSRISFSKVLNKYSNSLKIHEEHTYSVTDEYIHKLNKLTNIKYTIVFSKVLYNAYKKKIKNRLVYIPLSLNYLPEAFKISKLDTFDLIAIGRLEYEKGFLDLIEILNNVVKKNKKVHLHLFGEGSYRALIEAKIKEYNLENNITLYGYKDMEYISKSLSKSSLYLMTSYEESFGLVALEAMSHGVIVISFDSAKGVLDIVNNDNGFIIENRDINKYSETILYYLSLTKDKKKIYQNNALKVIDKFTYANVKDKWLKFIKEIN